MMRLKYVPAICKEAKALMINKPGKDADVSSKLYSNKSLWQSWVLLARFWEET